MKLTSDSIAGILQDRRYELPPQANTLQQVIALHYNQVAPDKIFKDVRGDNRDIGRVTIYRMLETFCELNPVCWVCSSDGYRK